MDPIQRIKEQADAQAKFKLEESRHNQELTVLNDIKTSNLQAMQSLVRFLDGKVTRTEVVNQLKSISTPDVYQVVSAVEKLAAKIPPQLDLSSLENGLKALEEQLKLIPKEQPEVPEPTEAVKVTNLDEIDFTTLEKAIKGIKITTPAPTVNVSPTDVSVDVDLKPIQKGLTDLLKTVKGLKFPEQKEVDLSKVEKKLDDANKHLKAISEKKMGGGGGGGNGTPYIDNTGKPLNVQLVNGAIPVTSDTTIQDLDNKITYLLDRLEYGNITDKTKTLRVQLNPDLTHTISIAASQTLTTVSTVASVTNTVRQGDLQVLRVNEAILDTAFINGILNNVSF